MLEFENGSRMHMEQAQKAVGVNTALACWLMNTAALCTVFSLHQSELCCTEDCRRLIPGQIQILELLAFKSTIHDILNVHLTLSIQSYCSYNCIPFVICG